MLRFILLFAAFFATLLEVRSAPSELGDFMEMPDQESATGQQEYEMASRLGRIAVIFKDRHMDSATRGAILASLLHYEDASSEFVHRLKAEATNFFHLNLGLFDANYFTQEARKLIGLLSVADYALAFTLDLSIERHFTEELAQILYNSFVELELKAQQTDRQTVFPLALVGSSLYLLAQSLVISAEKHHETLVVSTADGRRDFTYAVQSAIEALGQLDIRAFSALAKKNLLHDVAQSASTGEARQRNLAKEMPQFYRETLTKQNRALRR